MTRPPPDYVRLTVTTLRLLRVAPIRASALADALGVGHRTVERILRALEAEGEKVTREKSGREVWYRIEEAEPGPAEGPYRARVACRAVCR